MKIIKVLTVPWSVSKVTYLETHPPFKDNKRPAPRVKFMMTYENVICLHRN